MNVAFRRLNFVSRVAVIGTYVIIFLARCMNYTFQTKYKWFHGEAPIDILPDEIMIYIFRKLPLEELIKCESVCQRWNKIATDAVLWKRMPVVCSGQMGEISPRKLEIIDTHTKCLRCIKIQYMLNYSVIKSLTGKCKNLISIELIMCRLEKEFEEDLKKWPDLQKLDLKNSLLKSETDLVIQFDHFKKLSYLGLSDFGLSSANCNTLLTSYNLVHINIDKIRGLTLEYVKLLISTKQSTLEGLHLYGGTSVDDNVLFMLAKCPKLKELSITRCESLSDKALVGISTFPKITRLQLWNNTTFSESMLLATLKQPVLIKLKSLSLSKVTSVTPRIVDVISEYYNDLHFLALYQCPTITESDYEKQLKAKFRNIDVVLY